MEGNPDEDIKATRRIVAVWKEGIKVDRDKYRQQVALEKEKLDELRKIPALKISSGLISDFEGEKIRSNFGSGWAVSTDGIMGGKSRAQMELFREGAEGSQQSLRVSGEIAGEGAMKWAGVMFFPGSTMMAPANLSSLKEFLSGSKGKRDNTLLSFLPSMLASYQLPVGPL